MNASPSHEDSPFSGFTLNQLVTRGMLPQLDGFLQRLLREGKSLVIDGTRVFNGKDKFLPGKIAFGLSYLLIDTDRAQPEFQGYLDGYRRIAEMTLDDDNESWGIYYYLGALHRLQQAGLLQDALTPATLARLRDKLDWRRFVYADQDHALIDLPTNYYGVAFSIARLRFLLGWESVESSEILLDKMVGHYRSYSAEFGFSDETAGEGRFDRYSVLLIGEICHRFVETGLEVTPQLKDWLRRAVDVVLVRLNEAGCGFVFGRSIGAYGDTAFLEILATAAWLGVLSEEETQMAYAFQTRCARRYLEFWFDREMQSVNLWDKGRRTDAYRARHRILGENLSLLHQHIYTNNLWNRMGYRDRAPRADFADWLARLPRFTLTWFSRGEYDRAALCFRDGRHVIDLPLVNGGTGQHMHNPYFPIPFSPELVQGAADADFPQLLPRFTLADGSRLAPLAFVRDLWAAPAGEAMIVSYHQEEMDRLGEPAPVPDKRLLVATTYTLDAGVITRRDSFMPTEALHGVNIEMEFASFSEEAEVVGNTVRFGRGEVYEFSVEGFTRCELLPADEDERYRAPTGAMRTRVRCRCENLDLTGPLTLAWTLKYHR